MNSCRARMHHRASVAARPDDQIMVRPPRPVSLRLVRAGVRAFPQVAVPWQSGPLRSPWARSLPRRLTETGRTCSHLSRGFKSRRHRSRPGRSTAHGPAASRQVHNVVPEPVLVKQSHARMHRAARSQKPRPMSGRWRSARWPPASASSAGPSPVGRRRPRTRSRSVPGHAAPAACRTARRNRRGTYQAQHADTAKRA